MMTHVTKKGEPKILRECTLPVTGCGVTDMIVTDLAVIDVTPGGLVLREVAPGYGAEEIRALTGAPVEVSPDLREIEF
jgi:3-oxoacid CoA-transferase subunit B